MSESNADANDTLRRYGPDETDRRVFALREAARVKREEERGAPALPPSSTEHGVRLVRASDMQLRAPRWLLRGMFERPSLALVFGPPGCGKSFLGIEVACCVATGEAFHGLEVDAGAVVYVAGEGHNGIRRRTSAWEIARGHELAGVELFVTEAPVGLSVHEEADALLAAVGGVLPDGCAPRLVVVDTLARNFGPGDENATQDMGAFVAACDRIRIALDCTVLLIHHTGHANGDRARGARALEAATDTIFRMDKDEAGVIRLENTRQKDGELLEPRAFELRSVELGVIDADGERVTSAVLHPTAYEPPASAQGRKLGKHQTRALAELQTLHQRHRESVEASGRDPSAARVSLEDWRAACVPGAMRRQAFHSARDALSKAGIVNIEHGFAWVCSS